MGIRKTINRVQVEHVRISTHPRTPLLAFVSEVIEAKFEIGNLLLNSLQIAHEIYLFLPGQLK